MSFLGFRKKLNDMEGIQKNHLDCPKEEGPSDYSCVSSSDWSEDWDVDWDDEWFDDDDDDDDD